MVMIELFPLMTVGTGLPELLLATGAEHPILLNLDPTTGTTAGG